MVMMLGITGIVISGVTFVLGFYLGERSSQTLQKTKEDIK